MSSQSSLRNLSVSVATHGLYPSPRTPAPRTLMAVVVVFQEKHAEEQTGSHGQEEI
jgi:hypothetical protein